eukprot:CAMPEP_0118875318 /NCGR_PEP_ID=MMETSP1163-20130328/16432_1 /TAXON_ID=124430 /ORGANISM="Phaeomonas parva, Strain CCMP2877" /LENGTH=56 /DNA_ID=CAMNT_0006810805 /DNA_START=12 /DNA_END=179 /DNA_ORIENTATION=+
MAAPCTRVCDMVPGHAELDLQVVVVVKAPLVDLAALRASEEGSGGDASTQSQRGIN